MLVLFWSVMTSNRGLLYGFFIVRLVYVRPLRGACGLFHYYFLAVDNVDLVFEGCCHGFALQVIAFAFVGDACLCAVDTGHVVVLYELEALASAVVSKVGLEAIEVFPCVAVETELSVNGLQCVDSRNGGDARHCACETACTLTTCGGCEGVVAGFAFDDYTGVGWNDAAEHSQLDAVVVVVIGTRVGGYAVWNLECHR